MIAKTQEAKAVLRSSMEDGAKLLYFIKETFNCTNAEQLTEAAEVWDRDTVQWMLDSYEMSMGKPLFPKKKRRLSPLTDIRASHVSTTLDLLRLYKLMYFKRTGTEPKTSTNDFRALKHLRRVYGDKRVEREIKQMFEFTGKGTMKDLKDRIERDKGGNST